jgi:hypothetical protein
MFSQTPMQNDDIVARLQAYGQSLIEDSKYLHSASTQDSSGCNSTSKGDKTLRAEDGFTGLATAETSEITSPNTTIRVSELALRASSKDWTDSKQQWEVVGGEEDEAEFGELKAAGTAGSISPKSAPSRALTVGSTPGKSGKSSTSKGELSILELFSYELTPQ